MEVALRKMISAAERFTPLQDVSISQNHRYQRVLLNIIIMITL